MSVNQSIFDLALAQVYQVSADPHLLNRPAATPRSGCWPVRRHDYSARKNFTDRLVGFGAVFSTSFSSAGLVSSLIPE
jgi:hypothetical protein